MTPRRWRPPGPALVLAAVAIGAAIGVGVDIVRVGGLGAWYSARFVQPFPPGPPPYAELGRTYDVDGRAVYLDCRGSGSPTVILEAGFGADGGGWGWLLDDTAETTRVCAWDRPGLGRSDGRGLHSGLEAMTDLRAVLAAAGERGPYVVVAHSLGGIYALLFASLGARGAGDVVGFVMLDTMEPLVWLADDPGLDASIRDGHREVLARTGAMIQGGEDLDWAATMAELRALPAIQVETLHLPINMGSKFGDQSQPIPAALAVSWYRVVGEHYPNGRVEVVSNSGHVIHFDQPELVADRVREMVAAVRARAGVTSARRQRRPDGSRRLWPGGRPPPGVVRWRLSCR